MSLELLLARADDGRPALEQGLPPDSAAGAEFGEQLAPTAGDLRDPGSDVNDLAEQHWALVVSQGEQGMRLLRLVERLKELREREQGEEVRVWCVPPGMSHEASRKWKRDIERSASTEGALPHYLLILGDLDEVSLEFQQELANGSLVGRLAFDRDEDYTNYVDKVLRWEAQAPEPGRLIVFTAHDKSPPVEHGYQHLVARVLELCQRRKDSELPAKEILELGEPGNVDVPGLLAQVARSEPGILFTLSHGLGAPRAGWRGWEEKRARQGAMSLGEAGELSAVDLGNRPFMPGGAWFFFACFGAGTPSRSAYYAWLRQLRDVGYDRDPIERVLVGLATGGERPFIAALPKAVLANPEGPLVVYGHVDLAWACSYQAGRGYALFPRYVALIRQLLSGRRAGVGLGALLEGLNQVNSELTSLVHAEVDALAHQRAPERDRLQRSLLWMARQDLSNYVLLGDPAVRLPVPARGGRR